MITISEKARNGAPCYTMRACSPAVPVDIVEGERFRKEDEGEDNTESLPEGGDSDSDEGTKLTHKSQDNLKKKENDLEKHQPS